MNKNIKFPKGAKVFISADVDRKETLCTIISDNKYPYHAVEVGKKVDDRHAIWFLLNSDIEHKYVDIKALISI